MFPVWREALLRIALHYGVARGRALCKGRNVGLFRTLKAVVIPQEIANRTPEHERNDEKEKCAIRHTKSIPPRALRDGHEAQADGTAARKLVALKGCEH